MGIMFTLTDAGRRLHDHPKRYPQYGSEMMAILAAIQAHGAGLSFDDIVRHVPGEMFRVLQEMAIGMATGLLKADDAPPQRSDKDRGLGHGRW